MTGRIDDIRDSAREMIEAVRQSVYEDEDERGLLNPRDRVGRRLLRPDDGGGAHAEGVQGGRRGRRPRVQALTIVGTQACTTSFRKDY